MLVEGGTLGDRQLTEVFQAHTHTCVWLGVKDSSMHRLLHAAGC